MTIASHRRENSPKLRAALLPAIALSALGIALAAPAAQAQVPRGTCMVSDPTGTPLNVRR